MYDDNDYYRWGFYLKYYPEDHLECPCHLWTPEQHDCLIVHQPQFQTKLLATKMPTYLPFDVDRFSVSFDNFMFAMDYQRFVKDLN